MNVLVVSAHPSEKSLHATLRNEVLKEISSAGHVIRHRDLYQESFNPVFTAYERTHHVGDLQQKLAQLPELKTYVDDLRWCNALVLVYPTWWSAQPAILKGWIDRVFMNEVAWVLPEGAARIKPLLTNVKRLIVVTTHGSPKYVNALQGEAGKRIALRSIRIMFHRRVRTTWIGVYGLDHADGRDREKIIGSVRRRVRRVMR
ncbi:MAG: NAD(P)H-dependent oxidoreductase [Acidimicrobiaceae bacterium]|nr:NAD(P)H-dependent oxidoreductase [Ilumatobacteraceae bacterium]